MRFVRQHKFFLLFLALLVFCSVMVVRQHTLNKAKHVNLREAFILLYARGYTNEAQRIYQKLCQEVPNLSQDALFDDFQRTLILVDPGRDQKDNLLYNYHWFVSNELEKRSIDVLRRARKLAE